MHVKIRRHQHTRVHAHTGPRRHARAPACRRHHIPRLVRRQAFRTDHQGSPSRVLCVGDIFVVGKCVHRREEASLGRYGQQSRGARLFDSRGLSVSCVVYWRSIHSWEVCAPTGASRRPPPVSLQLPFGSFGDPPTGAPDSARLDACSSHQRVCVFR